MAAALENKFKRFIFTSTGATLAYQNLDDDCPAESRFRIFGRNDWGNSQVYKGAERGLDVVILHPIIVVGPYDYHNYAQIFHTMKTSPIKLAFPGKISFVHAADVARAHVLAFEKGRSCERYVLGGDYTTWLDFFQRVCRIVGAPPPRQATPPWVLSGHSALGMETVSFFTGKKPALTSEVVGLFNRCAGCHLL